MKKINVLGIHSSPILEGNVAHLLSFALQEATREEGVVIEEIALAGLSISDCSHCNWCMKKQTAETLCAIDDDATPILNKIRACDVLVLATPVYFARLSGKMACLIDRTRCFIFGRQQHMALRGKVGAALAVGWMRNAGLETTLESIHSAFLLHEMWTPSVHTGGVIFGVAAVAGKVSEESKYTSTKLAVMEDKQVLSATSLLMKRAVYTVRMQQSSS
jgi:multimeric flavodoxin WrbA